MYVNISHKPISSARLYLSIYRPARPHAPAASLGVGQDITVEGLKPTHHGLLLAHGVPPPGPRRPGGRAKHHQRRRRWQTRFLRQLHILQVAGALQAARAVREARPDRRGQLRQGLQMPRQRHGRARRHQEVSGKRAKIILSRKSNMQFFGPQAGHKDSPYPLRGSVANSCNLGPIFFCYFCMHFCIYALHV